MANQTDSLQEDIYNRFTYHSPIAELDRFDRYVDIRKTGMAFAFFLTDQCPAGRELSLAITHLEEAVMWANAAIARNERIEDERRTDNG